MAALIQKCRSKKNKVIVLSPNRSFCVRLENIICEDDGKGIPEIVLYSSEYKDTGLLITTYSDIEKDDGSILEDFDVVICDGISYLDKEIIEEQLENKRKCIIGFTSQVDGNITGYFSDAECVFRYTLQEALNERSNPPAMLGRIE